MYRFEMKKSKITGKAHGYLYFGKSRVAAYVKEQYGELIADLLNKNLEEVEEVLNERAAS